MLKKVFKSIYLNFIYLLIKIYSFFIKQDKNQILFYPDPIANKQSVDVNNYTSECVLFFFNYILKQKTSYKYVLTYYQDYQKNIPISKDINNVDLYRQIYYPLQVRLSVSYIINLFKYYREYFSSHIIITGDPLNSERLKKKTQKEFCISYYVPFKNDFLRRPKKVSNIDFVISGSKVCSQIDSLASNIPYEKYIPLGLPKWESLLSPRYSKEKLYSFFNFLNSNSKIIIYTPTHRDYERNDTNKRGFLGIDKEYDDLNEILKKHNTYLFVKLHATQNLSVIKNIKDYSNIKVLKYKNTYDYNLYDILPYSDLLISDYTSTYFDWLVLNKPAIFYWYDFEKYKSTRGFSWDPIENVCEGEIAYSYEDLLEKITVFLEGKYKVNKQKIDYIKSLVLGNNDNLGICDRILSFIKANE